MPITVIMPAYTLYCFHLSSLVLKSPEYFSSRFIVKINTGKQQKLSLQHSAIVASAKGSRGYLYPL